jgi:hypothetical protein
VRPLRQARLSPAGDADRRDAREAQEREGAEPASQTTEDRAGLCSFARPYGGAYGKRSSSREVCRRYPKAALELGVAEVSGEPAPWCRQGADEVPGDRWTPRLGKRLI